MLTLLLSLALTGLVVGALARLSLPGRDPMTIWQTIALGLTGSFIAGLLTYWVTGGTYLAGLTLSILCSSLLMYLVRRRRGGGLTDPGRVGRR